MELTVQNVYGLLLRSKLLSIDDCKAMFARWQEEARDGAANLARFAAWMVANRYVTEYQAALLARGHADGFFIGDYKILDRLGKGRMAGVYKAQHALGQVVAVKVLPPSRAKDPTLLARFQRESKLALRLQHPNVVRAFEVGSAGGLYYLVMEHLEGETLEDALLRRKTFPTEEAVRLTYQVLQGLEHIHQRGLVHRDLKPANLMLVPAAGLTRGDCSIKILDMGLGRVLAEDGLDPQEPGLTGEGVLLGTPDYMAPEQARDARTADIRADVYSTGCILYHLLSGKPPFPDTNIISQMIRHAREPLRPLKEHNLDVPDGLQQIIHWMMAKNPADRYPTPERAAQALEMFLAAGTRPPAAGDLDPPMQAYLQWLDSQDRAEASRQAHVVTVPVFTMPPVVAEPRRKDRTPDSTPPAPPTPKKRTGRKKAPRVPQTAAVSVDVELVRVDRESPDRPMVPRGGDLTRRDFFLFFAGVASGLIAYAIGRGFAALLRP